MIAVILFQINILTLAFLIGCLGRKRPYDGDRDVSLVQPCAVKPQASGVSAVKPANDDFQTGVPLPHIPLADKSDDRTLADIESIQSEKVLIKGKGNKLAAGSVATKAKTPTQQQPAQSPGKNIQAVSPAP